MLAWPWKVGVFLGNGINQLGNVESDLGALVLINLMPHPRFLIFTPCSFMKCIPIIYIYTYTYIHTYVRTYVRTYIHTYIRSKPWSCYAGYYNNESQYERMVGL